MEVARPRFATNQLAAGTMVRSCPPNVPNPDVVGKVQAYQDSAGHESTQKAQPTRSVEVYKAAHKRGHNPACQHPDADGPRYPSEVQAQFFPHGVYEYGEDNGVHGRSHHVGRPSDGYDYPAIEHPGRQGNGKPLLRQNPAPLFTILHSIRQPRRPLSEPTHVAGVRSRRAQPVVHSNRWPRRPLPASHLPCVSAPTGTVGF